MDTLFSKTVSKFSRRREIVFVVLSGLFLGTLVVLNIIGLTRILSFSFNLGFLDIPVVIPLGILPYPITFICADLITEFYGKDRARLVVWVGLALNVWVVFILWVGGLIPPEVMIDPHTKLPPIHDPSFSFFQIRSFALSGIMGSMIAYLVSQLLDVHVFQWAKKLTQGKHLWFRTNMSTLSSQFVDTLIIDSFAFFFSNAIQPEGNPYATLVSMIIAGYTFKFLASLLSTLPFYCAVFWLSHYFNPEKHKHFSFAALKIT